MAQARVEYVSIDAQIEQLVEQLGGPKAAYERAEALRREPEKAACLAKGLERQGKALQDQRSAAQHDYIQAGWELSRERERVLGRGERGF